MPLGRFEKLGEPSGAEHANMLGIRAPAVLPLPDIGGGPPFLEPVVAPMLCPWCGARCGAAGAGKEAGGWK